ncbi:MAG: hypothetical protein ACLRVU_12310 [Beduini sp.]
MDYTFENFCDLLIAVAVVIVFMKGINYLLFSEVVKMMIGRLI